MVDIRMRCMLFFSFFTHLFCPFLFYLFHFILCGFDVDDDRKRLCTPTTHSLMHTVCASLCKAHAYTHSHTTTRTTTQHKNIKHNRTHSKCTLQFTCPRLSYSIWHMRCMRRFNSYIIYVSPLRGSSSIIIISIIIMINRRQHRRHE